MEISNWSQKIFSISIIGCQKTVNLFSEDKMGYVTPVLLYNDSMHLMTKDSLFVGRLHTAILEASSTGPKDVPLRFYQPKTLFGKILKLFGLWKPGRSQDFSGSSSFAQVLTPQHADTFRLITVWGNTWTDIIEDTYKLGNSFSKEPNLDYLKRSIDQAKNVIKSLEFRVRQYEKLLSSKDEIEKIIKDTISSEDFRNTQATRKKLVARIEEFFLKERDLAPKTELFVPSINKWVPLQVKCDEENNPPSVAESKTLCVQIFPPEILFKNLHRR